MIQEGEFVGILSYALYRDYQPILIVKMKDCINYVENMKKHLIELENVNFLPDESVILSHID